MTGGAKIIVCPSWLRAQARRQAPAVIDGLKSDVRAKLDVVIEFFGQLEATGLPHRQAVDAAHEYGRILEVEMRRVVILSVLRGDG